MKTRIIILAALAAVLLGSCDKIFDGLIEVVYKDKLDNYGQTTLEVMVRVSDSDYVLMYDQTRPIRVALVPFVELTTGKMPMWGQRFQVEVNWQAFQPATGGAQGKVASVTFSVPKGYAYRAVVWQAQPGTEGITVNDPSTFLKFFFRTAYGADDELNDGNSNSEPYGEGYISFTSRLSPDLIAAFNGSSSGEASRQFSINTPPDLDLLNASQSMTFSISRFAPNRMGVSKIQFQRQLVVAGIPEVATLTPGEEPWQFVYVEYPQDSYYEFSTTFSPLYVMGSQHALVDGDSLQIAVKLTFIDNTESDIQFVPIRLYKSGAAQIAAQQPFVIDVAVDRWDSGYFGSKAVQVDIYNESGISLASQTGVTDSAGYLRLDAVGGTFSSTIAGGWYRVYVYVDTNGDGLWGGYDPVVNAGEDYYDQYFYMDVQVMDDSMYGGSYHGKVYGNYNQGWNIYS